MGRTEKMSLGDFAGWSRALNEGQFVYFSSDQPEEFYQCAFRLGFSKLNVDEFSRVVTLEDGTNSMTIIGASSAELTDDNAAGYRKLVINCGRYPAFACKDRYVFRIPA